MGGVISVPAEMDLTTFQSLAGFPCEDVFNRHKGSNGLMSRQTFTSLSRSTDVFLSHDWGRDELSRDNHERVGFINNGLKSRGLITWFDCERMSGNILSQMCNGIDSTQLVLVFVTQNYIQKVAGDNSNDNCQREFNYSLIQKSPVFMVAIVMEPRMRNTTSWRGPVGMALGMQLYVDMADEIDDGKIDLLFNRIVQMIRPRYINSRLQSNSLPSPPLPSPVSISTTIASSSDISSSIASAAGSNDEERRELRSLDIDEVCHLLEVSNLSRYKNIFLENEVDGPTLACVNSEQDLVDLGVTLLPKARKFFEDIERFKASGVPSSMWSTGIPVASSYAPAPVTTSSPAPSQSQPSSTSDQSRMSFPAEGSAVRSPSASEGTSRPVESELQPATGSEIRELISVIIHESFSDGALQSLCRIDECISNKNNHGIVAESGLIPILGDIAWSSTSVKFRWTAAHVLSVLSLNEDMRDSLTVLGERVDSGDSSWRAGGTTNNALIRNLIQDGVIKSVIVGATMFSLDRGNYAPTNPYMDRPQRIGYGARPNITTISAPHMHAHALENLCGSISVRDCKVLDVGCGSGYLTAAFARLNPMSVVVGIDHIIEMVQLSEFNMRKGDSDLIDSGRVKLDVQDAWEGYEAEAPYDLIHVGAAAATVPKKLLRQMKVGGKMFIPVGPDGEPQKLLFIERKNDEEYVSKSILGVRYVPLVNRRNLA